MGKVYNPSPADIIRIRNTVTEYLGVHCQKQPTDWLAVVCDGVWGVRGLTGNSHKPIAATTPCISVVFIDIKSLLANCVFHTLCGIHNDEVKLRNLTAASLVEMLREDQFADVLWYAVRLDGMYYKEYHVGKNGTRSSELERRVAAADSGKWTGGLRGNIRDYYKVIADKKSWVEVKGNRGRMHH
jgi:isopentenyl phosphate kinase